MKITAVETHVCNARMRNWVFVRVLTDEPGLVGWGEATLEWHTRSVVGAIGDLEPLLLGQDPTRVEHLWQRMFRQQFWHGNNLVRGTAISGIDLALWDILGKVHGVPCHRLWGGPCATAIRLYAPCRRSRLLRRRRRRDGSRSSRSGSSSAGFTAFKALPVPPTMPLEGPAPVRLAESYVAAMRDAVGDGIDIMVDCHARPSPRDGEDLCPRARAVRPVLARGAMLARASGGDRRDRPLRADAGRDRRAARRAARVPRPAAMPGVRVIQPDITHCGGLSEARRIAALAEAYGVAFAPHNPQGPVSTAASLELGSRHRRT